MQILACDLAGQMSGHPEKFQNESLGGSISWCPLRKLDNQPVVKDLLYSNYPTIAETDEYVIFDLQHPLNQQ
jgi:hypothetical protein